MMKGERSPWTILICVLFATKIYSTREQVFGLGTQWDGMILSYVWLMGWNCPLLYVWFEIIEDPFETQEFHRIQIIFFAGKTQERKKNPVFQKGLE
jgi:hypothetical protein